MVRTAHQVGSYGQGVEYEITVQGHLGAHWAAWFDGLGISCQDDGTTVIRGEVADQAALHGILQRVRDIGIPLVSFRSIEDSTPTHHAPTDERNRP